MFAKLIELGVYRDEDGIARHNHLKSGQGSYDSAPQKSLDPGAPKQDPPQGTHVVKSRL